MKTRIWVLVITNQYGTNCSAARTHNTAKDKLHAYVREWWDFELPDAVFPRGKWAAIRAYFEAVPHESYTLDKAELEP